MPPDSDSPPDGGWVQLMNISTTLPKVPPFRGQGPFLPPILNFILLITFGGGCLTLTQFCPSALSPSLGVHLFGG